MANDDRPRDAADLESAIGDDEPCYVISIAARLVGVHQQTLVYY